MDPGEHFGAGFTQKDEISKKKMLIKVGGKVIFWVILGHILTPKSTLPPTLTSINYFKTQSGGAAEL